MSEGWIKLHRKFLDWEWYGDHKVVTLFIHCLLKANHKKKNWRGNEIPRGTFITSYDSLKKETGLSTRELRTAFKKLESTGEIDKQSTSVNTWVTVNNYDDHQSSDKTETKERQSSDKVETTTKNEKNVKNERIDYVQYVDFWNEVNGCNLRITDKKREQIRNRLEVYTEDELKQSIRNRAKDDYMNGEGKKYKTNWNSFWRNDEKPERYLNVETENKVLDGGVW